MFENHNGIRGSLGTLVSCSLLPEHKVFCFVFFPPRAIVCVDSFFRQNVLLHLLVPFQVLCNEMFIVESTLTDMGMVPF